MDIVSYLYYKGMLYLGLKRYEDAMEQFRLVLSYPSACTHKVHTESYKKLVLLNLMQVAEGKVPLTNSNSHMSNIIPKNTHHMLKYRLENGFNTYSALIDAFLTPEKPLVFEELLIMKQEEFEKDRNWGLVKKLAKVFRQPLRLRMVELSDTYLTLKLAEINTSTYQQHHEQSSQETKAAQAQDLQTILF